MPLFGPEEGGRQTKIGWSRPKTVIFWPFLAFEGRLGGLKDPLEVRVEVEFGSRIWAKKPNFYGSK